MDVRDLSVSTADAAVLREVSIRVEEGEVVALVGSNGAGKTTLLRAVCGLLPQTVGQVQIDGQRVEHGSTAALARRGVVLVPTERHLFPGMTVEENLALGAYPGRPDPPTTSWIHELFPRLRERAGQRAGTMSGGEQQMLAIARALVRRPRLLLLDEPSAGLAPRAAASTFVALARLRSAGTTILVAEQQVSLALDLADRGYLLEDGRVRLEGSATVLREDERVLRASQGFG